MPCSRSGERDLSTLPYSWFGLRFAVLAVDMLVFKLYTQTTTCLELSCELSQPVRVSADSSPIFRTTRVASTIQIPSEAQQFLNDRAGRRIKVDTLCDMRGYNKWRSERYF